ncbi:succinate dehydrogenase, hydrophobic membrane anchor protein [Tropicimonas sp. S265A]|uniref:succinate dehydrogenase, hydrophobic membrane anchor protein n=1 Tax=Tropicimonas sp. S265A TaxID=3415134 RepID=UPI003C799A5F
MAYLTDRKRATGLGSAKTGTEHHWHMQISSVALLVLVPLFLFSFGSVVGEPYEAVIAHLSRPFPAIITGLMLIVGFDHFRHGVQTAIEDYSDGLTRKALIIAMICVSYGAMAVGLFALARLAL